MEFIVQEGVEGIIDSFLDSLTLALDGLGLDSMFVFGDLLGALGIDDEELLAAAFASFPMDLTIVTENDPEEMLFSLFMIWTSSRVRALILKRLWALSLIR